MRWIEEAFQVMKQAIEDVVGHERPAGRRILVLVGGFFRNSYLRELAVNHFDGRGFTVWDCSTDSSGPG